MCSTIATPKVRFVVYDFGLSQGLESHESSMLCALESRVLFLLLNLFRCPITAPVWQSPTPSGLLSLPILHQATMPTDPLVGKVCITVLTQLSQPDLWPYFFLFAQKRFMKKLKRSLVATAHHPSRTRPRCHTQKPPSWRCSGCPWWCHLPFLT